MDSILQGTTPSLTIPIDPTDFTITDIVALELRIKQKSNLSIYGLSNVTIDPVNNAIVYQFTEAETLAFIPGVILSAQVRFWFADGSIIGTNQMNFNVDDLLGAEVSSP